MMGTKALRLWNLTEMTGYKMSPTQFQQAGETRDTRLWQFADTPRALTEE